MEQKYQLLCLVLVVDAIGPTAPMVGEAAITFLTPMLAGDVSFMAPMPGEAPITSAAPSPTPCEDQVESCRRDPNRRPNCLRSNGKERNFTCSSISQDCALPWRETCQGSISFSCLVAPSGCACFCTFLTF
uniref:Putative secreted peptide n=1 Tax=Rhipicephalus pulchellus TaxID=72859 RepID=L7M9Q5_RHIPC